MIKLAEIVAIAEGELQRCKRREPWRRSEGEERHANDLQTNCTIRVVTSRHMTA